MTNNDDKKTVVSSGQNKLERTRYQTRIRNRKILLQQQQQCNISSPSSDCKPIAERLGGASSETVQLHRPKKCSTRRILQQQQHTTSSSPTDSILSVAVGGARSETTVTTTTSASTSTARLLQEPSVVTPWTIKEDTLLLRAIGEHGRDWNKIQSVLKSRTIGDIRTRANALILDLYGSDDDAWNKTENDATALVHPTSPPSTTISTTIKRTATAVGASKSNSREERLGHEQRRTQEQPSILRRTGDNNTSARVVTVEKTRAAAAEPKGRAKIIATKIRASRNATPSGGDGRTSLQQQQQQRQQRTSPPLPGVASRRLFQATGASEEGGERREITTEKREARRVDQWEADKLNHLLKPTTVAQAVVNDNKATFLSQEAKLEAVPSSRSLDGQEEAKMKVAPVDTNKNTSNTKHNKNVALGAAATTTSDTIVSLVVSKNQNEEGRNNMKQQQLKSSAEVVVKPAITTVSKRRQFLHQNKANAIVRLEDGHTEEEEEGTKPKSAPVASHRAATVKKDKNVDGEPIELTTTKQNNGGRNNNNNMKQQSKSSTEVLKRTKTAKRGRRFITTKKNGVRLVGKEATSTTTTTIELNEGARRTKQEGKSVVFNEVVSEKDTTTTIGTNNRNKTMGHRQHDTGNIQKKMKNNGSQKRCPVSKEGTTCHLVGKPVVLVPDHRQKKVQETQKHVTAPSSSSSSKPSKLVVKKDVVVERQKKKEILSSEKKKSQEIFAMMRLEARYAALSVRFDLRECKIRELASVQMVTTREKYHLKKKMANLSCQVKKGQEQMKEMQCTLVNERERMERENSILETQLREKEAEVEHLKSVIVKVTHEKEWAEKERADILATDERRNRELVESVSDMSNKVKKLEAENERLLHEVAISYQRRETERLEKEVVRALMLSSSSDGSTQRSQADIVQNFGSNETTIGDSNACQGVKVENKVAANGEVESAKKKRKAEEDLSSDGEKRQKSKGFFGMINGLLFGR